MTETAQQLVARLTGFTPGPWSVDPMPGLDGKHDVWTGWDDLICENARNVNAALIAAAPDLHRHVVDLLGREAKLRDALEKISKTTFDGSCCGCSGDTGFDEAQDIANTALSVKP